MTLTLSPSYKITIKSPGSLNQVRHAVDRSLSSPGATNLFSGAAVGSIKGNGFRLHFYKRGRNFWRPEFKGNFVVMDNHVMIVVRCGVSTEARVFTDLYLGVLSFVFVSVLSKFVTTRVNLNDFFSLCITVLLGFALPWLMFWNEFRYDRVKMRSILSSAGRAEPGENE